VAKVHRSTVSRVLAGKSANGRICPATQARIRSAASQLGYVRKPAIRFSLPVLAQPAATVAEPVVVPEPVLVKMPLPPPVVVAPEPVVPAVTEPVVDPETRQDTDKQVATVNAEL
jgi:hypothetical protein